MFRREGNVMPTEPTAKWTLQQRARHELFEFLYLFVYLYLTIGALYILKAAVLHDQGIEFAPWGIAIIKAAVLAKFILLGNIADFSKRFSSRPLIWPTIYKALSLLVVLVILTIVEEVAVGLFHHRSAAESIAQLTGERLAESVASILILLLVLVPYCAWVVLSEALGEGRLARMFFDPSGP
jgi:hypothetical protein